MSEALVLSLALQKKLKQNKQTTTKPPNPKNQPKD
jgi:hypothetical protein